MTPTENTSKGEEFSSVFEKKSRATLFQGLKDTNLSNNFVKHQDMEERMLLLPDNGFTL